MVVRSLVAAAAVAFGIGQAAEAATVENGKYRVNFTLTEKYWFCYMDCEGPEPESAPYLGLGVGDVVSGIFTFKVVDDTLEFSLKWSGGLIARDAYHFHQYDSNSYFNGGADEDIAFDFSDGMITGHFKDNNDPGYWAQNAVIEFSGMPAPVPIPASAALLPLGIGALAMLRRRRRLA